MAVLTVYPDASTGATTVDGVIGRVSQDQTFAAIIVGAGNQTVETSTFDNIVRVQTSTTSNQFSSVNRPIWTFDTSSIGGTSTVTTVVLSIFIDGKQDSIGQDDMHIVSATPGTNNDLIDSDYGQVGSTSFASVTYAGAVAGAFVDLTLNASGIANINKSGISAFGAKGGWDFNASFTGSWVSNSESRLLGYYADEAGTTRDPKAVITYTTGGGVDSSSLNLLGIG